MEECKKIKDLILTDFVDGELDVSIKGKVDTHLLACSECRKFTQEVESQLVAPLQGVKRQPVPDHLWSLIKDRIESEGVPAERSGSPIGRLFDAFLFPNWAPVLATIAISILVSSVYFSNLRIDQDRDKEQGEYLIYLLGSADVPAEGDNNGSESPIETFFL